MMEEIWKDIEGYEGRYQVSNLGRVRSLDRVCIMKNGLKRLQKGRIMAFFIGHDGYHIVKLCSKSLKVGYRVHRLVAMAFIENPNNLPIINHKDENKINNCVDNLEWCNHEYNACYGSTPQRLSITHKNHPGLSKPVEQFTMDGKFIKSYPSSKEAQRQTGIKAVNIAMCCRGKYSQSGGYLWRYKE
jgi:hypothetical protein